MQSDLAKLMEYIDSLQSEPVIEPVVEETEETNVHPLLQAFNELKEEGIVESLEVDIEEEITHADSIDEAIETVIEEPVEEEQVEEASPDTLEGSFTPDLVESKTWLAEKLAKGLKGKNAGTIYVLGSWYGNMGIFLQQAGVKFDKLVLVEPDEEALMRSKELLDTLNDAGKLILIHQKAEDIVYEKPGVVINTSCNETGPVFLTKLPDNMLCLLQARNNNEDSLFPTEQMEDFVDYFPLEKVYYTGEKQLEDPEVNYTRFMKIGRIGKKIDETVSTGQGGGSAGNGGAQMVGGPTTYEQEYGMFQRRGARRITAMTNEALDSSYEYRPGKNPGIFYFDTDDGSEYKVKFGKAGKAVEVAFFARGEGDAHKFGLTGTGNAGKIFGTVVQIVKDYIAQTKPMTLLFTATNSEPSRVKLYKMLASKVDQALPEYEFQGAFNNGNFTQFNIVHKDSNRSATLDKAKAKAKRSFNTVFEDTITLNQLYKNGKPDDNETIWDYGTMIWDNEYEIQTIGAHKLDMYLCHQYDVEFLEDLFERMSEEQHEIVDNYIKDPNLSNQIIVLDNGYIVDGNHRAIAAALTKRPIKYIDISDEEEL